MKRSLVQWLACPKCGGDLTASSSREEEGEIVDGRLQCHRCHAPYRIINGVPRFVEDDAYVDSFSFEWNVHRTTQLDSLNGRTDSEGRLRHELGFPLEDLNGKLVLDGGCGPGRFAEIALRYGATVIGVDLSLAVDAAYTNIGRRPNMHVVQADLFALPLKREVFDTIYSIGVLHHTPDCRKAFEQLPEHLKHGGRLAITVYIAANRLYIASSNFWRQLTTRLPKRVLYALCHVAVPLYYLYRVPGLRYLGMATFPINMDPDWRWRVLDTFDTYSPRYQSYHTHPEVFAWFEEAGLRSIRVLGPAVTVTAEKQR
jgi:SAM-dependent methyltransferase